MLGSSYEKVKLVKYDLPLIKVQWRQAKSRADLIVTATASRAHDVRRAHLPQMVVLHERSK